MIPSNIRAYHEAGHAVTAALLGMRVGRVTIRPDGKYGGRAEVEPVDLQAAPIPDRIAVYLAGSAGTWVGPAVSDVSAVYQGCRGDLDAIYGLLGVDALADRRYQAAEKRLVELFHQERTKHAVHALAGMLLEREELVITTDTEAAKILVHLRP